MSKKLICFIAFVLVLGIASTGSAGLELYLPFDGDPNDASGNGRHGTLMGDPAPVFVDGIIGQALDTTEGAGPGYVEITGYEGIQGTSAFSVAMWINTSDNDGDLIAWGSGTGGVTRFEFRVISGNLLRAESSGNIVSNTVFPTNEWIHVAFTKTENGVINDPDSKLYLNGQEVTDPSTGSNNQLDLGPGYNVAIARRHTGNARWFDGLIDDLQLYSRELTSEQVQQVMDGGFPQWPKADKPDPADGGMVEEASTLISWRAGTNAVAHDVYFGTTVDLGPDQLVSAQQTDNQYLATGIVPDQTYYWRVDEIDADGVVTTGDVYSFWTPVRGAWDPQPADGHRILNNTVNLAWAGGWSPISHQVYFGTDRDQVANDVNAPVLTSIGFDPGPLEWDMTYYWRVDEFYGTETIKGPVWTFNTVPVLPVTSDPNLVALWTFDGDTGSVALDQSGHGNHVILKNSAQVVPGRDGDILDMGEDGYGAITNLVYDPNNAELPEVTVMAWIRTEDPNGQYILSFDRDENYRLAVGATNSPVTEGQVGWHVRTIQDGSEVQIDYGSVTRVDDGQWHHVAGVFDNGIAAIYIDGFAEPSSDPAGPVFGTGRLRDGSNDSPRYGLIGANSEVRGFDAFGNITAGSNSGGPPVPEIDDLAIYNKAFSEDEMRQLHGNLSLAWQPEPQKGAVGDIWTMTILSWTPGDGAVEHDVYIGTDRAAVAAADASDTTGIYQGRRAETTHVLTVKLDFDQQYYWRIDEVAADGTVSTGYLWSFSTTDELVVSDEDIPFPYDNSVDPFVSEFSMDMDPALDLSDPIARLAISYTGQAAPGSVTTDDVAGTVTIVGRGDDIWGSADQFQFAYTMLTGDGSMTVKVESLANTHNWSKAGVMIRETLDPGSPYGFAFLSGVNGVRFEGRVMAGTDASGADSTVVTDEEKAMAAPVWLKIERTFPFVNAYYSSDGLTWTPMAWNPQLIPMSPAPVYIGLAVTSHSGDSTYAEGVFSNISSTDGVAAGPLASTEIGDMVSNSAEPMYFMLEDASGASAAVLNPDPAATQQTSATEWIIELNQFAIDLTAVVKTSLVLGNLDTPTPGGMGLLTIHTVRLLGPKGPIAHWTFDESAGTVAADSIGGNDGTLANGVAWQPSAGKIGGALFVDPADDLGYCEISTAGMNPSTGTIMVWINLPAQQPARSRYFVGHTGETDGKFSNRVQLRSGEASGGDVLSLGLGDTRNLNRNVMPLETEIWYHIALTWNEGTYVVYVDGQQIATGSYSGLSRFQPAMDIGNDGNTGGSRAEAFAGLLDDAKIFDRALSQKEIAKQAGL